MRIKDNTCSLAFFLLFFFLFFFFWHAAQMFSFSSKLGGKVEDGWSEENVGRVRCVRGRL